jgi:hypothetical protein
LGKDFGGNKFGMEISSGGAKRRMILQTEKSTESIEQNKLFFSITKYLSNFCLTLSPQKFTIGQVFVYDLRNLERDYKF